MASTIAKMPFCGASMLKKPTKKEKEVGAGAGTMGKITLAGQQHALSQAEGEMAGEGAGEQRKAGAWGALQTMCVDEECS